MKRLSSAAGLLALVVLFNLSVLEGVRAGDPGVPPASAENHFQKGSFEASAGAGILFSPFLATANRPTIDYELTELQLGYMLTPVRGSCFWRGNVEVAVSAFGGPLVTGQGSYVAGATAWLRYNFVPHLRHWAPFVQVGAGLTSTDLDRRVEGQDFNFNLNLGVGTRYFISRDWSVNVEYRYQHISNANMSSHNLGVNADGPMVSVSWFF